MDDRAPSIRLSYATNARHDSVLAAPPPAVLRVVTGGAPDAIGHALRPGFRKHLYSTVKRGMDIFVAITLIVAFAPLMAVVTFSFWRIGGTVLFTQTRVGKGGKLFQANKFRTMAPDADCILTEVLERDPAARQEWASTGRLNNDPRLTRIGRLLRDTQLDRLPQLWNVLVGDMSIVGPKPIMREELEKLAGSTRFYLSCKPGLTGLWQINGDATPDYLRRVALDRHYALTYSMWTDLAIMFKTIKLMLGALTTRG